MSSTPCTRQVFSNHDVVYLAVLDAYARYCRATNGNVLTEPAANVIADFCEKLNAGPSATANTLGFEFGATPQLTPWVRRLVMRRLELNRELLQRGQTLFLVVRSTSPEELEQIDTSRLRAQLRRARLDVECA